MWRILAGGLHVVVALLLAVVVNTWATALYAAIVLAVRLWLRHRRGGRPPRRTLRFTREGRYLVAITLGVGFAAINTGNNLLYLFLGMLLSMIIISGVLSEQTLRGLEVVRELPPQVFAQRPFLTGIVLGNRKRHLPSFSVQVEDIIQGRPLSKKCYFLKVPAQARQSTSYRTEFSRRGLYLVLALGARRGTLTPERVTFTGPDGPVPYDLRYTRWSGSDDDWTRIVQLRPRVVLADDTEYTVAIAPGVELIDGTLLAEGWSYSFRTPCAPEQGCAPEPADGGVQPVDAMVPDAMVDVMAPDAAVADAIVDATTHPDAMTDATAPDATVVDPTPDATPPAPDAATPAADPADDGCAATPVTPGGWPALLLILAAALRRRR